jgi:hypothetical protein
MTTQCAPETIQQWCRKHQPQRHILDVPEMIQKTSTPAADDFQCEKTPSIYFLGEI